MEFLWTVHAVEDGIREEVLDDVVGEVEVVAVVELAVG